MQRRSINSKRGWKRCIGKRNGNGQLPGQGLALHWPSGSLAELAARKRHWGCTDEAQARWVNQQRGRVAPFTPSTTGAHLHAQVLFVMFLSVMLKVRPCEKS